MKKATKEKAKILAKYVVMWIATVAIGFISWVFLYTGTVCGICEPKTFFWLGVFGGVTGTACYFMLFSLLTPVAKWVWGKVKHNPKDFIKLIR